MCTVSQLCETLARAANMPLEDVKKYARALINSGDLPKAVGRSIPKMDMRHRAKLILAIASSERPSDCVVPMRERYDAVSRFRETDMTAGELLAGELEELASESFEAFQKWTYSQVEVSRGGMPKVRFLINENLRSHSGFEAAEQPEFLGGPWLATSYSEIEEFDKKNVGKGLAVSAFVPGRVLMDVAFGSHDAAWAAAMRVKKAHKELQSGDSE